MELIDLIAALMFTSSMALAVTTAIHLGEMKAIDERIKRTLDECRSENARFSAMIEDYRELLRSDNDFFGEVLE